jgi:hypothetical protein
MPGRGRHQGGLQRLRHYLRIGQARARCCAPRWTWPRARQPGTVIQLPFRWPQSPHDARADPPVPPPSVQLVKRKPWLAVKLLARDIPEPANSGRPDGGHLPHRPHLHGQRIHVQAPGAQICAARDLTLMNRCRVGPRQRKQPRHHHVCTSRRVTARPPDRIHAHGRGWQRQLAGRPVSAAWLMGRADRVPPAGRSPRSPAGTSFCCGETIAPARWGGKSKGSNQRRGVRLPEVLRGRSAAPAARIWSRQAAGRLRPAAGKG